MTDVEKIIADIEAVLDKATPGEWTIEAHGDGEVLYAGRGLMTHGLNLVSLLDGDQNWHHNRAYIAACSPDRIRALVDEVRRLREERDDSEERCGKFADENQTLYDKFRAAQADRERWQAASRETFEAMVAMRDSINEYVQMPSLESDLAQGPSYAVFCENVASAVVARIRALEDSAMTTDDHNALHSLESAEARAETAEASLREAVQVIRTLVHPEMDPCPETVDRARAFLAKQEPKP